MTCTPARGYARQFGAAVNASDPAAYELVEWQVLGAKSAEPVAGAPRAQVQTAGALMVEAMPNAQRDER